MTDIPTSAELRDGLRKLLDAKDAEIFRLRDERISDRDAIKAALIEMRLYIMHHGVLMGECVGWNKLKKMFGVGVDEAEDMKWLENYREQR